MKKALFVTLFLLAFAGRIFQIGPNVEFVTGALILASIFLGQKYAIWLVMLVMVSTDIILGNTNIFLFTWTGFLIPAIFASRIIKKVKLNKAFVGMGAGVASNIFFFLWTNFGVWALDSWGMYEKNLGGLMGCYINGLPFLRNQIVSTLLLIPLGYYILRLSLSLSKHFSLKSQRSEVVIP